MHFVRVFAHFVRSLSDRGSQLTGKNHATSNTGHPGIMETFPYRGLKEPIDK